MLNSRKVLKIGDLKYSMSLQKFCLSFKSSFPQRDEYFKQYSNGKLKISYYCHDILDKDSISNEKSRLATYLKEHRGEYKGILFDNPLSFQILPGENDIPLVFDMIDWYEEMYKTELVDGTGEKNRGNLQLISSSLRELLKVIDGLVVQSPLMLDYAKSIGFDPARKNIIIPNGYDHKVFYPYDPVKINEIKNELAEKFNIDLQDKIIVVYQGKLGKWYQDLEFAVADMNNDAKIVAFIIGDGALKDRLQRLSAGNIIFTGALPLKSVPVYTNVADVCIFPVNDCSPIAISEYIGVGKPIVARKGRISWLVKDARNGCLVDEHNRWKENIFRAWENRAELSRNNRELALNLSWKSLARVYEDFLADVVHPSGEN